MAKQWLDNAFWETEKKELLNCISVDYDDEGREVSSVHKLKKYVVFLSPVLLQRYFVHL